MKPTSVALLSAFAYLAIRIGLYVANLQHQYLTTAPFMPLFILVFMGIAYVILMTMTKAAPYNWVQAFKEGGKVAFLAALVASAGVFIYYKWIDTDYLEVLTIDLYNQRKAEGFNEEELGRYLALMKQMNQPFMRSTLLLSGTVAWGLASSLILALLHKMIARR